MLFYTFAQRVRHALQAKNRHGIHSPFVFNFVEEVLNQKKTFIEGGDNEQIKNMLLNDKQTALLQSIVSHYQCEFIHQLPTATDQMSKKGKLYLLSNNEDLMREWGENDIIVLTNIYRNRAKTQHWKHCIAQQTVKLSIDLFDLGLLFFKPDFIEKQHFILH